MAERGSWEGMWKVVSFNWTFYLGAAVVLAAAVAGAVWLPPWPWKLAAGAAIAGSLWFITGSLGASHWVYDRSDLYRWHWLERACRNGPQPVRAAILCHSGFDEASPMLRERLPAAEWTMLDHYNPEIMREPSIQRARRRYPPMEGTVASTHARWPHAEDRADVVFALLAIHELRTHEARVAWFSEASRCLSSNGRLILVEHLRDFPNFLAFGPGFLHFHSETTWRRAWSDAGLACEDRFTMTPFVAVFVLEKSR